MVNGNTVLKIIDFIFPRKESKTSNKYEKKTISNPYMRAVYEYELLTDNLYIRRKSFNYDRVLIELSISEKIEMAYIEIEHHSKNKVMYSGSYLDITETDKFHFTLEGEINKLNDIRKYFTIDQENPYLIVILENGKNLGISL